MSATCKLHISMVQNAIIPFKCSYYMYIYKEKWGIFLIEFSLGMSAVDSTSCLEVEHSHFLLGSRVILGLDVCADLCY